MQSTEKTLFPLLTRTFDQNIFSVPYAHVSNLFWPRADMFFEARYHNETGHKATSVCSRSNKLSMTLQNTQQNLIRTYGPKHVQESNQKANGARRFHD